jgi:hypothetical protein
MADLITIHHAKDLHQAPLLKGRLETAGIPALVPGSFAMGYDFFPDTRVQVSVEHEQNAEEILRAWLSVENTGGLRPEPGRRCARIARLRGGASTGLVTADESSRATSPRHRHVPRAHRQHRTSRSGTTHRRATGPSEACSTRVVHFQRSVTRQERLSTPVRLAARIRPCATPEAGRGSSQVRTAR